MAFLVCAAVFGTLRPCLPAVNKENRSQKPPKYRNADLGNAIATSGNALADLGNPFAASGKAIATLGNASATLGNVLATLGNALATLGKAIATPGNVLADPGNASATLGNVIAEPGTPSADLGEAFADPGKPLAARFRAGERETPRPLQSPVRGDIVVEPTNKLFPSSVRSGIIRPIADCSPAISPLRGFGFLLWGFYKDGAPTALGICHSLFFIRSLVVRFQ